VYTLDLPSSSRAQSIATDRRKRVEQCRRIGGPTVHLADKRLVEKAPQPWLPAVIKHRKTVRGKDFIRDPEWLESVGWQVQAIWGRAAGIDVEVQRDGQRWMIEAKGSGSRDAIICDRRRRSCARSSRLNSGLENRDAWPREAV
jgi:hypothetical protein